MQRCSRYQLQISKLLTFFTSLIILETIRNHGRPIETGSPKQPLHFRSRLMSTTYAFMNFSHNNSGLIRVQTLEKQIFSGSTIKLIINQNIFEGCTPNISLCTTTRIFKVGDYRNPLILISGPFQSRISVSYRLSGQTGLWTGQTGLGG